jgi:hypothetical protein
MTPRSVLLSGLAALAACVASAQTPPGRAAWMRTARWGVMSHYLADWRARADHEPAGIAHWNALIDHFEVEGLADQLASVGAGWYLISLGQNSGYYLSPNATYDRLTGLSPSKLSRRDLVADLAAALAQRGIKLLVYLPSGAPAGDHAACAALGWENGAHRNAEFQRHWEAIIAEWSHRWGRSIAGWWFDGCYWPNAMYRTDDPPNFSSFAAAARAGNAAGAVAFNPGVYDRPLSLTPHEDYLAGEIDQPERWTPKRIANGSVDGAQLHVLSYLGATWGQGAPRFTNDVAVAFARKVVAAGGALTWDTPIQKGGTFAPEYIAQLKAIGEALAAPAKP